MRKEDSLITKHDALWNLEIDFFYLNQKIAKINHNFTDTVSKKHSILMWIYLCRCNSSANSMGAVTADE